MYDNYKRSHIDVYKACTPIDYNLTSENSKSDYSF